MREKISTSQVKIHFQSLKLNECSKGSERSSFKEQRSFENDSHLRPTVYLHFSSSEVIWNSLNISVDEVKACFPNSSGLVLIHSNTRTGLRAKEGFFELENGQHYIIPSPSNQGRLDFTLDVNNLLQLKHQTYN